MTIKRVLLQVRLAVSFLTIVPVRTTDADGSDVAASMAWFPLIGLLLGVALALEDHLLAALLPHATRSALIVLSLTLVTGALHLDGLADTADALGAGRDRDRALEILRDSRIGAFGAIALFFALALKLISIETVFGRARIATLILAPMLSRWSMVAVSYQFDYLRTSGAGSAMLGRGAARNLGVASILALAVMLPLHSGRIFEAYGVTIVATLAMRRFYRRRFGGITGDLIGACGEIVEVLAMIALGS